MNRKQILCCTAIALGAVLLSGIVAAGAESTFQKSQMYVVEGKKMVLRNVTLTFNDSSLLVKPRKAALAERTIPYSRIKGATYEFSAERRWGAAVVVSPLFLLSKSKKHWFTIVCKPQAEGGEDEEVVFRLDKKNYAEILDAFEKSSGIKVKMEAPKG